ncbi:MAG: nitroreductase family deazaflavin-dependent oxidoreductase [Gammaproteobacteria bacterium]|nr:nitroreductase/quinone reductase family protein [Gammaproteobacteria bacterium]MXY52540.1 nitroreductase family deazaflavin-dependent oxidoreductase [Gammaproteobacteria bacterium]
MKLPEPLFVIINPLMRLVLSSPLHFVASGSLLLMRYRGRRSGIWRTTPLRYVEDGDVLRCFSSRNTLWWRNLQGGAQVTLTVRGKRQGCEASVVTDQERARALLAAYLDEFPQDAAYHDVSLTPSGQPDPESLERAASNSVVVEARRTP